jgi:predicted NAD/FAD-binding protein
MATILTPNLQSRLPGFGYSGSDPDGHMTMPEVGAYLQAYAERIRAPVEPDTTVIRVSRSSDGYTVTTNRETWACRALVIATGASNVPDVPALAAELPEITSLTPFQYRSDEQVLSNVPSLLENSAPVLSRIMYFVKGCAAWMRSCTDYWAAAAMYDSLNKLSDAELRKRGLSRTTIAHDVFRSRGC